MKIVAYTSLTYAYLTRAVVLANSLRRAHPDWPLHALLVDEPSDRVDLAELLTVFDSVVFARDLGIPQFKSWMFRHDVVEACTAVKGAMLRRLLAAGADTVVYLDPDIAIFHPLESTLRALDRDSIVLTPHQVEPSEGMAARDNEMGSLRYGIYNLGFLAVRNDRNGHAFASWWDVQLRRECYDEPERGVFTDQKFCDLVPGLFDGVHIDRDPGCNVASWNLSRRTLSFTPEGGLVANGSAVKFYHFTKIFGVGETMTLRASIGNPHVLDLVNWYRRQVLDQDARISAPAWAYGTYSNGVAITKSERVASRQGRVLNEDPFQYGPSHPHQTTGGDPTGSEKFILYKKGS